MRIRKDRNLYFVNGVGYLRPPFPPQAQHNAGNVAGVEGQVAHHNMAGVEDPLGDNRAGVADPVPDNIAGNVEHPLQLLPQNNEPPPHNNEPQQQNAEGDAGVGHQLQHEAHHNIDGSVAGVEGHTVHHNIAGVGDPLGDNIAGGVAVVVEHPLQLPPQNNEPPPHNNEPQQQNAEVDAGVGHQLQHEAHYNIAGNVAGVEGHMVHHNIAGVEDPLGDNIAGAEDPLGDNIAGDVAVVVEHPLELLPQNNEPPPHNNEPQQQNAEGDAGVGHQLQHEAHYNIAGNVAGVEGHMVHRNIAGVEDPVPHNIAGNVSGGEHELQHDIAGNVAVVVEHPLQLLPHNNEPPPQSDDSNAGGGHPSPPQYMKSLTMFLDFVFDQSLSVQQKGQKILYDERGNFDVLLNQFLLEEISVQEFVGESGLNPGLVGRGLMEFLNTKRGLFRDLVELKRLEMQKIEGEIEDDLNAFNNSLENLVRATASKIHDRIKNKKVYRLD